MPSRFQARLAPLAVDDLQAISDYLADKSPASSRKVIREILAAADNLRDFPEMGKPDDNLQPDVLIRSVVVRTYRVFYRVEEANTMVWILRVWDTRQDPRTLKLA